MVGMMVGKIDTVNEVGALQDTWKIKARQRTANKTAGGSEGHN